jgi:hypothetical protein
MSADAAAATVVNCAPREESQGKNRRWVFTSLSDLRRCLELGWMELEMEAKKVGDATYYNVFGNYNKLGRGQIHIALKGGKLQRKKAVNEVKYSMHYQLLNESDSDYEAKEKTSDTAEDFHAIVDRFIRVARPHFPAEWKQTAQAPHKPYELKMKEFDKQITTSFSNGEGVTDKESKDFDWAAFLVEPGRLLVKLQRVWATAGRGKYAGCIQVGVTPELRNWKYLDNEELAAKRAALEAEKKKNAEEAQTFSATEQPEKKRKRVVKDETPDEIAIGV